MRAPRKYTGRNMFWVSDKSVKNWPRNDDFKISSKWQWLARSCANDNNCQQRYLLFATRQQCKELVSFTSRFKLQHSDRRQKVRKKESDIILSWKQFKRNTRYLKESDVILSREQFQRNTRYLTTHDRWALKNPVGKSIIGCGGMRTTYEARERNEPKIERPSAARWSTSEESERSPF